MSTAIEKAFHMIRQQRCSSAVAVEAMNTFNLSTTKTEETFPKSANLNSIFLAIFLMNSSHEGKDIGMEQWRITFLPATTMLSTTNRTDTPEAIFKKFCIFFRSLEAQLRFLPTYRLVKESHHVQCESSFHCDTFQDPNPPQIDLGNEPSDFEFKKISSPVGDFSLSVHYRIACPMSFLRTRDLSSFIRHQPYGTQGTVENISTMEGSSS